MKQSLQKYNGIDIMKFIMSFFVVAIHTGPFIAYAGTTLYTVYDSLARCAVPFFFMASGFLIAQKVNNHFSCSDFSFAIRKHLLKILKLYLVWTAIYFPLTLIHLVQAAPSLLHGVYLFLRGFLFVGENYNSWMLWYLLSTIYALGFILLLQKLGLHFHHILKCGIVIHIAGILITKLAGYSGELPFPIAVVRFLINHTIVNGRIFTGFLYIPLGMHLSKYPLSRFCSLSMFLGALMANLLLDGILGDLSLIVCSIGLFAVVIQMKLPDSPVYPFLRVSSTVIYLTHMYVWTLYYTLVYHQKTQGMDSFLLTSLLSLLLATLYFFCRKNRLHSI